MILDCFDFYLLTIGERTLPGARPFDFNQQTDERERVAKWLGISSDELRQPKFFSRELQHTTKCALWAAFLRDMYPDAEIVRDVQVLKRRVFQRESFGQDADRDSVPDIVLTFRGEMMTDSVSIAVEIERTRKSDNPYLLEIVAAVPRRMISRWLLESGDGLLTQAT